MNNKVLNYDLVSKVSEVTRGLHFWLKGLWDRDRKLFNQLKVIRDDVKSNHETLSYYIMSSNELSVYRVLDILNSTKTNLEICENKTMEYSKNKESDLEIIQKLKVDLATLQVFINLTDHDDSIYSQL